MLTAQAKLKALRGSSFKGPNFNNFLSPTPPQTGRFLFLHTRMMLTYYT